MKKSPTRKADGSKRRGEAATEEKSAAAGK